MEQKCLNCRFSGVDNIDGFKALVCRRYAPRILSGSGTGWSKQNFPVISTDVWCGEYEEDPEHRFQEVQKE